MRYLAGGLGGVLLALVLFVLLALLVAPPEQTPETVEPPAVLAVSEAPAASASAPPPAAASSVPTPPAPPPPAPLPSPVAKSEIHVPEPEPEPPPKPQPPKREKTPEPEPEPEPKPEPKPQPQPVEKTPPPEPPAPSPQSAPAPSDQSFMASAAGAGEPSGAADTATDAGPVSSPQPTRRVPPKYPPRAQRRGLEGYVEVTFTIRPDGSVDKSSLEVTDASPRRVFERAALRAIADWQFPSASAPRRARQRLEFKLKG